MRNGVSHHLFAGVQDIATIQGTGSAAKAYHNAADLLNSSTVMTDSAGAISETMDYYPFGSLRIDSKIGAFSEQRKYIGQEYDADTGLNYLNARYYNATLARFISQDPMFWSFNVAWLTDPQNQNSYAYARNNPIAGSDPSGLLTAFFPGTWTESKNISANFIPDFKSTFVKQGSGDNFWMPSQKLYDNDASRQAVAHEFTDYLSTYQFKEGETFNIGGHSHGGNVGIIVSQMTDRKIDNLVTLGTPERADYQPGSTIQRHINAFSYLDAVQSFGGEIPSSTWAGGIVGGILGSIGGPIGSAIGATIGAGVGYKLGWGEASPAGKKFSGAENVNVTWEAGLDITRVHQNLSSTSVWSKIDKQINK